MGRGRSSRSTNITRSIGFDEGGRKVFATRLVALQASSEPAPPQAATRKRAVKKKKVEAEK